MSQLKKSENYIHLILDLSVIDNTVISSIKPVSEIVSKMLSEFNFTEITLHYHQFDQGGISGVHLLSESHFSIHSWPEKNAFCIDLFSCEDFDTNLFIECLLRYFDCTIIKKHIIHRL